MNSVRVSLAGLSFDVTPDDGLSEAERQCLGRLERGGEGPVFTLTVTEGPGVRGQEEGAPASVDVAEGKLQVSHADFFAELDPLGGSGHLRRVHGLAFPLEITLRAALCARLPLTGGLPLHAAGVVVDGRGVAFFGPSGAGKSTLASTSIHPVLSDELVALLPGEPMALAATGFWGTLGDGATLAGRFSLRAVVELAKGPEFCWERLPASQAFRRLAQVVLVPPGAALWTEALGVLDTVVRQVPVYRMEWSPTAPPWGEIARRFAAPEISSRIS